MSWNDIPEEVREELLDKKENGTLSAVDAARYEMPYSTLKRRLREMAQEQREKQAHILSTALRSAAPKQTVYTDYIHVELENALICSDWEFPDTDPEMLVRLLLIGIKYNIRELIIVGDTTAGDQASLNTWAEMIAEREQLPYKEVLHRLQKILKALGKWFTKITITNGNHDERLQKATGGNIDLGTFLQYACPDVRFSLHRKMYLTVPSRNKTYKLTHPRNYSKNSLGLGQKLSNNDPGPNGCGMRVGVLLAHTHHGSFGFTEDGSHEVIGLGCMRLPKATKYKSMSDGTNPEWNQGFVMLYRGYFYPLWKDHTDWELWLGDFRKYMN